jgi:hypothetical protein
VASHCIKQLLEAGHTVVATVRDPHDEDKVHNAVWPGCWACLKTGWTGR